MWVSRSGHEPSMKEVAGTPLEVDQPIESEEEAREVVTATCCRQR
jgi:hypothetical protein